MLANLSTADNAKDFVLLMAFNETSPPTKPQGTSKLSAYQAGSPPPAHSSTILQGLQAFGYAASVSLAADDSSGTSSSPDSSSVADSGDGGSTDTTEGTGD